ncbi:MAG: carboxypeptidase regulatory-like domain-containing protein, partial [Bryobacteraceae bacterium]
MSITTLAQTVTGTLEGRLTDPAGAAIPGASVRIKEVSTGAARSAQTNAEGLYQFAFLALGTYDVTAEAQGFQTQAGKAAIALNRATVLSFNLKLAGVQQEITVTDAAPVIDTISGQVRRSLDDRLIESLPMGRSIFSLVPLLPGFQTNPTSGQNNPSLSSGSSASFNGTGTRATTFQTDGVANDDASENQHRQNVNISTIREFQVLTNNFGAEFGRGAGAVVLIQTKNGTNQFHGETFFQTANSALNARSYFANEAGSRVDPATGRLVPIVPKTASKSHRFGAVADGPILRDKLFFLGSFERSWSPGAVNSTVSLLPREYRAPRVDPQLPDAAARRAWIQSILDRYPNVEPNNTVNNPNGYTASVNRALTTEDGSVRIDYQMGERDIFYARYQITDFLAATEELVRGTNAKQDNRSQSQGLTWTHVFSPS